MFDTEAVQPTVFRFAYDCGGQHAQSNKTLNWCIDHAVNGMAPRKLQAVYLSHFEQDHVNGIFTLCKQTHVERIYVPYITSQQALQIAARDAALGVEWSVAQSDFLGKIFGLASGGSTLYGVPVTKIRPSSPPAPGNDDRVDRSDALWREEGSVRIVQVSGAEAADYERTVIGTPAVPAQQSRGTASASLWTEIWELVHWSYASEPALTDCILLEIEKVQNYDVYMAPALMPGATDVQREAALLWVGSHYKLLAQAYKQAITQHNTTTRIPANLPEIVDHHNVVSLCLYSSVSRCIDESANLNYSCSPAFNFYPANCSHIGWLTTGDAMLKLPDVWKNFAQHFGQYRLQRVMTIVIPHHGADATCSNNFNHKLLDKYRNCIISSGVHNSYGHPHRRVVQAILAAKANLHCVNENQPLGFCEVLTIELE